MSTRTEVDKIGPPKLTPVLRRLLNHSFFAKGRSGLVMSPRRRDKVMRKEKALQDYFSEHPWYGQIEGWQREVIRRTLYGLQHTGRGMEARRLRQILFTLGDILGKEVIWPILDHLLNGGVFHFQGQEICGDRPNTKNLASVPLEEFLMVHVQARPEQLLLVRMLFKAQVGADELVRSALEKNLHPGKQSDNDQALQMSSAEEKPG